MCIGQNVSLANILHPYIYRSTVIAITCLLDGFFDKPVNKINQQTSLEILSYMLLSLKYIPTLISMTYYDLNYVKQYNIIFHIMVTILPIYDNNIMFYVIITTQTCFIYTIVTKYRNDIQYWIHWYNLPSHKHVLTV